MITALHERLVLPTSHPALTLVELSPEDQQPFFEAYNQNPDVMSPYNGGGPNLFPDMDAVEAFMREMEAANVLGMGMWLDNSQFVGCIHSISSETAAYLGYWQAYNFWGNGHASRAIDVMTEHLLDQYGKVIAQVLPDNERSIRRLEGAGYRRGPEENGWVHYFINQSSAPYALIA